MRDTSLVRDTGVRRIGRIDFTWRFAESRTVRIRAAGATRNLVDYIQGVQLPD
jgi:hypothetical protein